MIPVETDQCLLLKEIEVYIIFNSHCKKTMTIAMLNKLLIIL